ncbi:MAG: universal stress protein [Desulfobaccales bacterium]
MFKKILVPLDGSDLATKIIPQVADLARSQNAELVLLNVYNLYSGWGEPITDKEKIGSEEELSELMKIKNCKAYLTRNAQDLEGVKTSVVCINGTPAEEIIAYADKHGVDLIAMATHSRSEVAWVLGSVAEKVASRATIPVLLLRVVDIKPPKAKVVFDPL